MGALGIVRDVAIVLLAVESLVIGVLLAVMLLQLKALIKMLREEVAPLLDSAGDTAQRVKGTVGLVTDTVITPLIRVRSWAAGARQAMDTLFFFRGRQGPSDDGSQGGGVA